MVLATDDSFVVALKTEYLGSFISPNNSLKTLLPLPITVEALPSGSLANLPFVTVIENVFNTSGVSAPAVRFIYLKAGKSHYGFVLGTLSKTILTIDHASCSGDS